MKTTFQYFLIIPLVTIIISCSILPKKRCWKEGYVQHDSTWFPAPQLDYDPQLVQVRLAYPVNNKKRIWVKGNSNYKTVAVNGQVSHLLEKPFFTRTISISSSTADSLVIDFIPFNEEDQKITKVIYLDVDQFTENDSSFSFLFYGCFQPFTVDEEGNPLLLHDSSNTLNYDMRQLFEAVSLEKEINYFRGQDSTTLHEEVLVHNPSLIIGTGDQVYVDAGYENSDFRNHAISGWAHACKDPYPLLNDENYLLHLDRCYRHFYSFSCFKKAFSHIPSIGVWDDHEIRDGWGSHGDEYSAKTGEMNESLKPYFQISKRAFIENQFFPEEDVDVEELIEQNHSLEQQLNYKGIPIFAFDLRSNRNIHQQQVINEEQLQSFMDWCSKVETGKEALIISSMPVFYKPNKPVKLLGRLTQPGLRDDINDGWYSTYNERQREVILLEIIRMRERGVKPIIIAGDAHLGGIISVWYNSQGGEKKKLCYELIYSGLSHEVLGEERSWLESVLRRRSEGREVEENVIGLKDYQVAYKYDFNEARLNFGSITFSQDTSAVASLFIIDDTEEFINEIQMPLVWTDKFTQSSNQLLIISKRIDRESLHYK